MTFAAADTLFAYRVEGYVTLVLFLVLLGVKVFALCDALFHKDAAYVAADKQNKAFWLVVLVLSLVLHLLFNNQPHGLLSLVGTVAALVYLLDVRPTLRSMHHR